MAIVHISNTKHVANTMLSFPILDLPPELIWHIVKYVRKEDRIWLARTCFDIYAIVKSCDHNIYIGARSFATPINRLEYFLQEKSDPEYKVLSSILTHTLQQRDLICSEKILLSYPQYFQHDIMLIANILNNGGNLQLLIRLYEKKFHWNITAYAVAARKGHIHILQWLKEIGCIWNESVCGNAASGGQLAALQWLKENGCPWNHTTCISAAISGHLGILQWLRENDCPWNKNYILSRNITDEVREWVTAQPV